MYGWRARIGLVLPANNNVMEPELYSVAPDGVSFHASRMLLGSDLLTPEAVEAMERNAHRALEELVETNVGAVAYACMATSIVKGRAWDEAFRSRLQHLAPSLPLQSAASAVVEALGHLGARRIAVASPYPPAIAERVSDYFQSWGIAVVDQANLATEEVRAVGDYPPDAAYRLARQLALRMRGADAVALLATDFRTFEVIQPLEYDLGCPVVSTNQAVLWWVLRACGVRSPVPRLGRLLTET